MRFEVYHTGLLGRPQVIAVDMIQYPGLWGLCFSHHAPNNNHPRYAADTSTAGTLRFLDSARVGHDGLSLEMLEDYTVMTHHVDADAVLPVWSFLNPEAALERRDQLERIARAGDFFLYLDEFSARINAVIEQLHFRGRGSGKPGERHVEARLTQTCFDWLLPRLEWMLDDPEPFREFWEEPLKTLHRDLAYLERPGRVTEHWSHYLSIVETDHEPDPHALNTACRNDLLLVWRTDSLRRRLEVRPAVAWYELTSLPHRPRYDLADLATRLNRAEDISRMGSWEFKAGPVQLEAAASSLTQDQVLATVTDWLAAHSEERLPSAYKQDVEALFRGQPRHAVFNCHERFALADRVAYEPCGGYEGVHFVGAKQARTEGHLLAIPPGRGPLPFAVADDFYWNRKDGPPLQVEVTFLDREAGQLWVEYDGWSNAYCKTESVTLSGSGEVKTARFPMPGARLGASQEQGSDFRLARTADTPVLLSKIAVSKCPSEDGHVPLPAQITRRSMI